MEEIVVQEDCLAAHLRAATVVRSANSRSTLCTATVVRRATLWPRKNTNDGAARDYLGLHGQGWLCGYARCAHSIYFDLIKTIRSFALGDVNHSLLLLQVIQNVF